MNGAVRVGAVCAQGLKQGRLDVALARNTAGGYEHERLVPRVAVGSGLEDHLRDIHDVCRQLSVANRVLGDECEQAGVAEVVPAFEQNAAVDEIGLACEEGAQCGQITFVEEIYCTPEAQILDAFVVRKVQAIGEGRVFEMTLQSAPVGEAALARDGELGIGEGASGGEDFRVRGRAESGVELTKPLGGTRDFRGVLVEQIAGFTLEVREFDAGR